MQTAFFQGRSPLFGLRLSAVFLLSAALCGSMVFAKGRPVTIVTRDAVPLSGIVETPDDKQPIKAAVLIIQGSGNVGTSGDVSSDFVGKKGYQNGRTDFSAQIAEELAKDGIASLRYAKRGSEDATRLPQQTMPYIINDAADALAVLHKLYPDATLDVLGFSEGATVATMIAQTQPSSIGKLLLLGLPTQTIDQILEYQLLEWPVEMAIKAARSDGSLDTVTAATVSASHQQYDGLMQLINTAPAFQNVKLWLDSMRALPAFEAIAKNVKNPVYLFEGAEDTQVRASRTVADSRFFPSLKAVHVYPGLGHCFSPLDGPNHDVKTSGPIQNDVLKDLAAAVLE